MIDLPVINNEKKLLSLTYFVVLKKKENFSLILAYPVTGRKNQPSPTSFKKWIKSKCA